MEEPDEDVDEDEVVIAEGDMETVLGRERRKAGGVESGLFSAMLTVSVSTSFHKHSLAQSFSFML